MIGKFISPATPAAYVAETSQAANQYRSQSGQVYQMAAANAPQRPMLNPAYADLNVGVATVPPAAAAPSVPAMPVSQPTATTTSMFAPPTAITQPAAAVNALAGDRYASPTANPAPAVPATPPLPSQTANPYVPAAQPVVPPAYAPPQYPQQAPIAAPVTGYDAATPTEPVAPAPTPEQARQPAAGAPKQPTAAAAAASPPTQQDLPAGAAPLGFDGYCPVSMRTHWKWVPGDVQFGAVHRGRTYIFAGPQEQQQFLANPDYYAPALSGIDPVLAIDHRQSVPGIREHSLDYDNQFFLFSSEATLEQFTANPQRYTAGVRQAMGMPPTQRR
jgi:YHS domain-containing protein